MSTQIISGDGRKINIAIELDDIYAQDKSRLAQIVSDGIISDDEMVEILRMKMPTRGEDIQDAWLEHRKLQRQREDLEAMRQAELAYQKSMPPIEKIKNALPAHKIPMSSMTKQKLTWIAIVGPSAMGSLAILLIGLL